MRTLIGRFLLWFTDAARAPAADCVTREEAKAVVEQQLTASLASLALLAAEARRLREQIQQNAIVPPVIPATVPGPQP